ncbi:MAG: flagellar hook-basal body complex protein FliE [Verrucomicrobia bacterium]|nr:flagellar hook-basal body complex protein FliE [Verrucomicrobiota bacterium]
MRPQFPMRRAGGSPDTGIADPALESIATPQQQVGFENVLGKLVQEVNAKQMAAGDAVTGLLSGQQVPLHQAMIAMEEASVSFQLMVEVRNKLLEGYQELIRMQV